MTESMKQTVVGVLCGTGGPLPRPVARPVGPLTGWERLGVVVWGGVILVAILVVLALGWIVPTVVVGLALWIYRGFHHGR
jgi:hypothetical protein